MRATNALFDRCYHPAMQADYFRLCYLSVEGGFYVDADDVCLGTEINRLFDDGRLKVQPLCYDRASGTMVSIADFLRIGAYQPSWIFYVNNNPLIASKRHPVSLRCSVRLSFLNLPATAFCQKYRRRPDRGIYRSQFSSSAPLREE